LRTLRMVRLIRFVRGLRTLIHSVLVTMKSLVWAMVLMFMIFYGFGVAFVQAVVDHYAEHLDKSLSGDLGKFWGSLPRAMYTLLLSITNGISWINAVTPLAVVGEFWIVLFLIFIMFTVFAVLNVITSVFCQSAIDSAAMDKDMVTMHMMANKKLYVDTLMAVFNDIDNDGSGVVTISEFERYLAEDRCKMYLDSLDINTQDAWALFKLLDTDKEGTLDLDEFISGCLNLKGSAKAMHFAKLDRDNQSLRRLLDGCMEAIECRLNFLIDVSMSGPASQPNVPYLHSNREARAIVSQMSAPRGTAAGRPPLGGSEIRH